MIDTTLIERINLLSSQTIQLCYHCHKCTAGCPVASEMTYGPDRVLRLVQFGEKERLLASHDIWLCAGCETCGTRCPNEIDIARVMDALRQIAIAEGVRPAEPYAEKFHKTFLFIVQNMGRMHEASLLAAFKLWTMDLLSDMDSAPAMLLKGKIPLLPHLLKGRGDVRRIFEETSDVKRET
ncbi:MAG: 4Fe-4S dicluster domain-containing protein [Anaerolineales bacterium]|nr:4Fe-4S dicluster domain-containing protein [Anaerolineales bacterium]